VGGVWIARRAWISRFGKDGREKELWVVLIGMPLAHFPQFSVLKGQNSIGICQKILGYQPLFFENQM
jgi:hypothetical protein